MEAVERVDAYPKIILGKAATRETRIPVEPILRKLGEGVTTDDLLDAYPRPTTDDIRGAILFDDGFPCPRTRSHSAQKANNTE